MFQYFLYFWIYPLCAALVIVLIALAGRIFPEFGKWLQEVWPNQSQKEALVILGVIGLFLWGLFR